MTLDNTLLQMLQQKADNLNAMNSKLQQLEVHGGGGGPSGPIRAMNVIYTPPEGVVSTDVQAALDDIYGIIGDVSPLE